MRHTGFWQVAAWLLVTWLVVTLAYQTGGSYDLSTPGVTLSGFHALEGGKSTFRWTADTAGVNLNGLGTVPTHLVLTLSGARPNGTLLPGVRVFANGGPLGTITATRAEQDYAFDIPAAALQPWGDLSVEIDSDTFVPPNDLRTLGVAVYALRVETVPGARVFPPPLVLAWAGLAVVLLFLYARAARVSPGVSVLLALLWLALFSAGIARERAFSALLVPWLALVAAGGYAGIQLRRRTGWTETAAALTVGVSALHFGSVFLDILRTSRFTDVTTMFEAAQKLAQGLDPYDYAVVRDNALYAHSYVYPPAFAQFLALWLPLGLQGAILAWVLANFVLYLALIPALMRVFAIGWRSSGMYLLLLVALNFRPALDTLYGGQLDILILGLLVVALACAQRGRWPASGGALALAALTKLHPAVSLPFYLTRARWRGLIGFLLTAGLLLGISALLSSPQLYVNYATVVLPGRGGESTGNPENQSIAGFLYRLNGLTWDDRATGAQAGSIRLWTYVLAGVLLLLTLAVVWRTAAGRGSPIERAMHGLHLSLFVTLTLLILPTSWMHYQTQLLLPLGGLLAYATVTRQRRILGLWLSAAALSAFANQEIFRDAGMDTLPLLLLQSYKFYALLLVWGALVWGALQLRAARPAENAIVYAQSLGDGAHVQRTGEHQGPRPADPAAAG